MSRSDQITQKLWSYCIYIEKGLSRKVAETYHSRPAFAMGDGWAWPGFSDDLRNGAVSRTLGRLGHDSRSCRLTAQKARTYRQSAESWPSQSPS